MRPDGRAMLRIAKDTDCYGAKAPRNDVFLFFGYVRLYGKSSVSYVFARSAQHDVAIRS